MNTVFFDIDTQYDFMVPAGALYVRGAEAILPAIAKLNRAASVVISTTDAHTENDEEFRHWPPHCVAGTLGQQKPSETLLDKQVVVPWKAHLTDITGAKQIILQKRVNDAFRNPNLAGVLQLLNADRFVLYGVVTEICVHHAAEGLLKLGKPVALVTDAIRAIDEAKADEMIGSFASRGGTLTTTEEALRLTS